MEFFLPTNICNEHSRFDLTPEAAEDVCFFIIIINAVDVFACGKAFFLFFTIFYFRYMFLLITQDKAFLMEMVCQPLMLLALLYLQSLFIQIYFIIINNNFYL